MIRSRSIILATTLHALAGVTAARADEAGEKIVRDLITAIDSSSGWNSTAKSVRSEGTSVIVEGWNTNAENGTLSINEEIVRFEGVSEPSAGGIAASSVTIKNGKLSGAVLNAQIPDAILQDFSMPAWSPIAFDSTHPFSSLVGYYRLAASIALLRLEIPQLTVTWQLPAAGSTSINLTSTAVYSGIVLENMKSGRIGRQHVETVTANTRDNTPGSGGKSDTAVSYNALEGINVDLNAFLRVADPAEYRNGVGDGIWMTLAERTSIGKMSLSVEGQTVLNIGGTQLVDMKVRQPETPILTIIDGLVAKPPEGDAATVAFMTGDFKSLAGAVSVDSIVISDLAAGEPGSGSGRFDSLTLDRLTPDGLGHLTLLGLSIEGPQMKGGLKSFEIREIGWPRIDAYADMMKLEESRQNGQIPDPSLVAKAVDSAFDLIPKVGGISLGGLSLSIAGSEPITLDSYQAAMQKFIGNYPLTGEGSIVGLHIPGALLRMIPNSGSVLDTLGYTGLNIGLSGRVNHDATSGQYDLTTALSVDEAGKLTLGYGFGGLTVAKIKSVLGPVISSDGEPDPMQLMALAGDVSLDNLQLRFEDASLTKRLLGLAAKMQNTDETTLVATTTAMIQLALAQLKHPDFTNQVIAALNSFLKEPKSITLAISPPQPVRFLQIMQLDPSNPGSLIDLLGVSVIANN